MKILVTIIYWIFYQAGVLFHFFVDAKKALFFTTFKREFNTGWLKKEFKSCGVNTKIDRPLTLRGGKYISIGENVLIGRHIVMTVWNIDNAGKEPELVIGDGVELGDHSHITCANKIVISSGVLTGKRILITDNSHGSITLEQLRVAPKSRPVISKGGVFIGKNVWIGEKASIMPGVTIGEGSIIGANSVVTSDIPPYSVAVGTPARIVKRLTNQQ